MDGRSNRGSRLSQSRNSNPIWKKVFVILVEQFNDRADVLKVGSSIDSIFIFDLALSTIGRDSVTGMSMDCGCIVEEIKHVWNDQNPSYV